MLTKNHLKIHTSKPRKDNSRKKRVYFNIEAKVPNFDCRINNFHHAFNDGLKLEILELCYGDIKRKLHQLIMELVRKERYPDEFRQQCNLINSILEKMQ